MRVWTGGIRARKDMASKADGGTGGALGCTESVVWYMWECIILKRRVVAYRIAFSKYFNTVKYSVFCFLLPPSYDTSH